MFRDQRSSMDVGRSGPAHAEENVMTSKKEDTDVKKPGKLGGMGGPLGGTLHNVGSAQSGMTGGSGMGGNSPNRQTDERVTNDAEGTDETADADVQQRG